METTLGTPTVSAIAFFLLIVSLTLAITYWAAKRTRSTKEFYAAGRSVSQEDLLNELKLTRPLSVVMAEKVLELREWARDRTVPCD